MNRISTRLATLDDVDLVAPLFDAYRQFYSLPTHLKLARDFLAERLQRQQSFVILAADGSGKPVGFAQLYPTYCSLIAAPIYTLSDLFVAPTARRAGAGRALLIASESLARQNDVARLDLTTARTNIPAQSLYESLGWTRDHVFFAYSKSVDPQARG